VILLGLTGSIGMGKSTTAGLLREEGVPVHDSDAAVHDLYAVGGAAVGPVGQAFPSARVDGRIDRARLAAEVVGHPEALERLEALVHPLVAAHRDALVQNARRDGAPVVAFDIPLLFETGAENGLDAVVVVSAPADVQRRRVLARPGMTAEKFEAILARQTPDPDKRARADFIVDTGHGVESARAQVREILHKITAPGWRGRHSVA
jgi:dephospho-CoA kinase